MSTQVLETALGVLDRMINELNEDTSDSYEQIKFAIQEARDAIANLPICPSHDGWIDVNERLPEADDEYLAFHSNPGMMTVRYFNSKNKDWGWPNPSTITHWQPLPKPPTKFTSLGVSDASNQ